MDKTLPKVYDPKNVEKRIYNEWMEKGYFRAEADPNKPPFSIVIPPPNVTGQLHLGHAFDNAIQDILTRFRRMQGYSALWLPGTDHAGIATQARVEANLREEGKTRYDLGREAFVDLVWDWKKTYGGRIVEQLKTLGSSCDWSRERFTMDEGCSKAVREVFVSLYEEGLIYKGSRIINWCPDCITALSDVEVEYEEQDGNFWHIKYPVEGSDEFVVIATTRPETMLGDTAVAVNPSDKRYAHLVGKTLILPLVGRKIPVIADEYVEADFGTGCVKITPCHDPNDFEVAARHDLPHVLIMDDHAVINKNGGKYEGMSRYEARKAIIKDLEGAGLLVKTEPHIHNVGSCYRCGTTVEPIISDQWFVKMKPLAQPAMQAVADGRVKFVPDRFSKIYMNWMENVHDWCISRQLWWGHRIPAFYCKDCGETIVSREDVTVCPKCDGMVKQDEDVLDTWFSSALWPFSTMGWPDKTPELSYFYPTTVVTPAYDIIFFWVARMIVMGLRYMNDVPFKTVYMHGLVRDDKGKKMSKSSGNGIDPMDIIDEYGADALRFNIITGNSPGNDMRFYTERCEAMRNFCNKVWNASRFVLMNIDENTMPGLPETLEAEDKWILTRLNRLVGAITENLDAYELGVAAQKLYDFIWSDFCDWYIELTKPRLQTDDRGGADRVLSFVLERTLTLLHPFMPFITEEIWQTIPHEGETLMLNPWPKVEPRFDFPDEERSVEEVMELIRAVRNRRAEMNVPPSRKAKLIITSDNARWFEDGRSFLMKLAYASELEISIEAPADLSGMTTVITSAAKAYMPTSDLVDTAKELARMEKSLTDAKNELSKLETKLNNPGFTGKAPEKVVAAEHDRMNKTLALITSLEGSIKALRG